MITASLQRCAGAGADEVVELAAYPDLGSWGDRLARDT
jgi:hypothetical protein